MSHTEKITLGGGCFWCLEAVYEQVQGVLHRGFWFLGFRVSGFPGFWFPGFWFLVSGLDMPKIG